MKALFYLVVLFAASFCYSQSDVWVNGYARANGTYVEGHYRTTPNSTVNDNFSTVGNRNPYTGEWGNKPREFSYTSTSANNTVPPAPIPNNYNPLAFMPQTPPEQIYNKPRKIVDYSQYSRDTTKPRRFTRQSLTVVKL